MSVLDKTAPHYFDYNPDFATESHFAPLDAGQQYVVSGGSDGEIIFTAIARSTELTPLLGVELTLYWLDQYGGRVVSALQGCKLWFSKLWRWPLSHR